MTDEIEGLIATHFLVCRGIDNRRYPVLDEKSGVNVIVRVAHDGRSAPLCPYIDRGRCAPPSVSDSMQGKCPYCKESLSF